MPVVDIPAQTAPLRRLGGFPFWRGKCLFWRDSADVRGCIAARDGGVCRAGERVGSIGKDSNDVHRIAVRCSQREQLHYLRVFVN